MSQSQMRIPLPNSMVTTAESDNDMICPPLKPLLMIIAARSVAFPTRIAACSVAFPARVAADAEEHAACA